MVTIRIIHIDYDRSWGRVSIVVEWKPEPLTRPRIGRQPMIETQELRDGVREAYSAAASHPEMKHAFPVGRQFAESVGYPADLLDSLPDVAVDAFAGVSNVAVLADIPEGVEVLDLGCGAGLDALVAARRAGSTGHVSGVDFSESMIGRARQAAEDLVATNVEFLHGDAEQIPLPDASVDVALVNGIFNLNPARKAIFQELARVVRQGGSVIVAELILCEQLPQEVVANRSNWFA